MEKKVILITGSSRGIGRLTALELASRGHCVIGTMRKPVSFGQFSDLLTVKRLDVTDRNSIKTAIHEIIEEEGRLDVVVNNAGYGLLAPVEIVSEEEMMQQFDVNVYGAMRVVQEALPQMREQKNGHVINVSSIAGISSNPCLGWYCATKHALEALSASLAATVFQWNIQVSVIQPASTATEFAEELNLAKRALEDNPYGDFAIRYQKRMENLIKEGQPPQEVAELIADVIESPSPHFRYQTSPRARELASQFVVDPSGDRWLDQQKETFSSWLI
jgi:NAD(P)-dependent dehydrogenase (short-subunit alcohol dehydrogenase family)